jgi:hypothetical protein
VDLLLISLLVTATGIGLLVTALRADGERVMSGMVGLSMAGFGALASLFILFVLLVS